LNGLGIFDHARILPYASLMTCYIIGSGTFGMLFGFFVDKSDYYGLPIFLLTVALTVCGAYLGIAENISASLKLFFCFLSPSVALAMGVIVIEGYLYQNGGSMDYNFVNHNKEYPNLNNINGVILAASVMYFGLILMMPFDWLFRTTNSIELYIASKNDDIKYPCDNEEEEKENSDPNAATDNYNTLLSVKSLSQVYPDGTHAVKDMNFRVKRGEVLSFLGSNGAGKSTTMKMLCGTLDATYGDATVNGYSITTQRTMARRNLGIAMQQDIIWVRFATYFPTRSSLI
jgi:ABC-type multidrug transport system fused ATPase/permease subunit